jgi:hypothetical protein
MPRTPRPDVAAVCCFGLTGGLRLFTAGSLPWRKLAMTTDGAKKILGFAVLVQREMDFCSEGVMDS